jgi:hypothetical protein
MMEIGGLGSVPKDLGVSMSKILFAPRLGITYRLGETAVLRGGFGITNDPYSLARSMRTNHPILLNLVEEAAHSFTWVRPIEQGIPPIPDPVSRTGSSPCRATSASSRSATTSSEVASSRGTWHSSKS